MIDKQESGPQLSTRGEIRLGFRCNARCGFCYYQDLLDNPLEKEPKTSHVLKQLRAMRRFGTDEVEFTGGEPTVKPDLPEIIRQAKTLGFVNVSLITNGLRFSNFAYAKKLVDAGLNDILFSLHGSNKAMHDMHTGIPGSFEKIIQAMENANRLGIRVRITTTVTSENCKALNDIIDIALQQNAQRLNLAVFSPVAQADETSEKFTVAYPIAAKCIKQAIVYHQKNLPPLSVKYIPFCYMEGYEQYVMNLYQQSFDPDDWNYYISNITRRAPGVFAAFIFGGIALLGALFLKNLNAVKHHGFVAYKVMGFTRLVEFLRKRRLPQCRHCKYDVICDHVWKNYPLKNGGSEVRAIPGKRILHPAELYTIAWLRQSGVPLANTPTHNENSADRIWDIPVVVEELSIENER